MMKIVVDPGVYVLCMVWTLAPGLGNHQGSLSPSVQELRVHVQIDHTHHGSDSKHHIEHLVLQLDYELHTSFVESFEVKITQLIEFGI